MKNDAFQKNANDYSTLGEEELVAMHKIDSQKL